MEDTVISQFLLEDSLRNYFLDQEKKIVFLRGDKDLPYGFVIEIMDILKKAGVETIGLISAPKEEEKKRRDNR
jgi:biopolymer transport protein ExbD